MCLIYDSVKCICVTFDDDRLLPSNDLNVVPARAGSVCVDRLCRHVRLEMNDARLAVEPLLLAEEHRA
jgi:hypothetical protein